MFKSILIFLLSFLAATFVAAQDAFVSFEGTSKTYYIDSHVGSSYNWVVYSKLDPLVTVNAEAVILEGNGSPQVTIRWDRTGKYFLLVTETDARGCVNTKAIRINVLPGNSCISFANNLSSACYQGNNNFTIPVRLKDGNGQPLGAAHFPVRVEFRVNGTSQPTQAISFTNQNLAITGSSCAANPSSDTPVGIAIMGATDVNNLNIQPESDSGLDKHTRTIFRDLTTPTVTKLTSNEATPVLSGTAKVGQNETFSVSVNGLTYFPGDGNLTFSGNKWALKIPVAKALPEGTFDVTAKVANALCSLSDVTSNELAINLSPASAPLATNDVNITFRNSPVSGNVLINDAGFYGFNPIVSVFMEPVNGTVAMETDGRYTYTPKTDFTGIDNFYYLVSTTRAPADCDTVNVTVRVVPEVLSQIPPVAIDDETQVAANMTVRGNVLANDLSVSGEKLILNLKQKGGPKSGSLDLNGNGSFAYTPREGFVGQDYFIYEICGEVSGLCAEARATITVSVKPEMNVFAGDDVYFSNGSPIQGDLLLNDVYASADNLNVNRNPVVNAFSGTVSISSNGTFSYTPVAGFTGTDQFVYEIRDSKLKNNSYATVSILVREPPALYADLAVMKTGPQSVIPGGPVSYELLVTNLGTATASGIQISDYLPAAIENPKYSSSGTKSVKNWDGYYELAELEVNKTFSLFISGTIALHAPDTLKNVATVSALSWDPNPENNISVVKTKVDRSGPVARIAGSPYLVIGRCNTQGRMLDASKSSGEGLSYSWAPSDWLDDAATAKPVFKPGRTTRYRLTVTDAGGQKDTTSVLVVVADAPEAVTDKNVFVDASDKTVLLNGNKSTGAGLTYLWMSKEGIILNGETTPAAQVSGLGTYYLQVTDSLGCIHKDSVNIGLYIQAISDTAQTKVNESVMINVIKNDIPARSINASSVSVISPPLHGVATVAADSLIFYEPEEYYVGQDEFIYQVCDYFRNCDQARVLVLINDIPLFIPEAFSPNGDGINDKFEIKGLAKYKAVEVEIFNRWGNVVYHSRNYGDGQDKDGYWDGVVRNGIRVTSGPVPSGTYFYVLKLNGKQTINGSIYLDR